MPGQKLAFPGRNFLFCPGPTHIPNEVMNAMVVPQEDHRAPDLPELVYHYLKILIKSLEPKRAKASSSLRPVLQVGKLHLRTLYRQVTKS